jgi:hypothetical protein
MTAYGDAYVAELEVESWSDTSGTTMLRFRRGSLTRTAEAAYFRRWVFLWSNGNGSDREEWLLFNEAIIRYYQVRGERVFFCSKRGFRRGKRLEAVGELCWMAAEAYFCC